MRIILNQSRHHHRLIVSILRHLTFVELLFLMISMLLLRHILSYVLYDQLLRITVDHISRTQRQQLLEQCPPHPHQNMSQLVYCMFFTKHKQA